MTLPALFFEEIDTSWMMHARCRGVSIDVFFPERGVDNAAAKTYCSACPVQRDCLEYALRNHEFFGVWGGESERSRSRMRKALGIVGQPRSIDDILFGTEEPAA